MARMARTWGLQAAGVAAAVVFALLAGPTISALPVSSEDRVRILRDHLGRENDTAIKHLIQSRLEGK